jgi:DNA polymerase-1
VPVRFVKHGGADLTFGVTAPTATQLALRGTDPEIRNSVAAHLKKYLPQTKKTPWDGTLDAKDVLYLDIETHEAEKMWDMPIGEFFRLGQFSFGPDGEIIVTEHLGELMEAIKQAEALIAHNGHPFDFSVLLGDDALDWSLANRLFDTMVYANQAFPAPTLFSMRNGNKVYTEGKPEMISRWLSLDNLAFKLDSGAKEGDLKALAKGFGGFGLIPKDDPRYVEYARNDITMLSDITHELLLCKRINAYDWRDQLKAAIDAQMSRNGFRVDVAAAQSRVAQLAERKAELMVDLVKSYGLPATGKMPWRTTKGKESVLAALASFGIRPEHNRDWPMLKTGPSLSGPVILTITAGTDAEEFGITLAELQGQRSLAEQALEHTHSDGKVHPSITGWQRSGRRSVTKPGLTTWGERNPIDKAYLIASEGHKLVEFDLSNADQRIVAAFSKDPEYAKRFIPGADGHEITGRLMYGTVEYSTQPIFYRNKAKALSHAWSFGAGTKTLARTSKQPIFDAERFVDAMNRAYPGVIRWQNKVRRDAEKGYVVNHWGRKILVDVDKAYTQAPAAHGQSGTTEVLYDGLIKLAHRDPEMVRWLVCPIHDAVLMDIPEGRVEETKIVVRECMEQTINGIDFPVSSGPTGTTWENARHT